MEDMLYGKIIGKKDFPVGVDICHALAGILCYFFFLSYSECNLSELL
jgi:hypothetical protein